MSVNEMIQKRRSIRRYEEGAVVTEEQIKTILEAGMLAPSACNSRPWEFLVVRNREKLNEIVEIHPHAQMLSAASLGIVICADVDSQTGVAKGFYPQDCAAATQNILLQSAEMDLGTCWCGVYPKEDLIENFRRIFELPENMMPFCVIAVGVPVERFGSRGHFDENKIKWID